MRCQTYNISLISKFSVVIRGKRPHGKTPPGCLSELFLKPRGACRSLCFKFPPQGVELALAGNQWKNVLLNFWVFMFGNNDNLWQMWAHLHKQIRVWTASPSV